MNVEKLTDNFNGAGKVGAGNSTPHSEVIPFPSFPKD